MPFIWSGIGHGQVPFNCGEANPSWLWISLEAHDCLKNNQVKLERLSFNGIKNKPCSHLRWDGSRRNIVLYIWWFFGLVATLCRARCLQWQRIYIGIEWFDVKSSQLTYHKARKECCIKLKILSCIVFTVFRSGKCCYDAIIIVLRFYTGTSEPKLIDSLSPRGSN